jgi:hypothetical protein
LGELRKLSPGQAGDLLVGPAVAGYKSGDAPV